MNAAAEKGEVGEPQGVGASGESMAAEQFEVPGNYEELVGSSQMRFLTETNDIRMEEELTRPRVEIWPDDFEWQQWVSQHEQGRRSLVCQLASMKASPFCAYGYH